MEVKENRRERSTSHLLGIKSKKAKGFMHGCSLVLPSLTLPFHKKNPEKHKNLRNLSKTCLNLKIKSLVGSMSYIINIQI